MKWKQAAGVVRSNKALATALRANHKLGEVALPPKRRVPARSFDIARAVDTAMARGTSTGMQGHRDAMRAALERRRLLQHTADASPLADEQAERQRRLRVLQGTFGMWKDRDDIPKDGLQYQLEARSEWD
jgi:hypothetical protein